ncbi:hypothetical protein P9D39_24225 [Heyndrickxia oleronia]|uniref:Uncharacterized protein n=1 Tax=Heyndrickxia oleronia TaxID=38875 RepID=A0A8E2LGP4_9BACI|nr:hypothetical protein [Heyndrickxia oleronia]MEC1377336.1 hypothetical protein [Heyndrickxia oleronia]OOP70192.1 hypothetical protein BWZ43_01210 [Heyndrickxia oleronia]QQZ05977.1 hypothetical protein I5818_05850 [Heyndrickxia oleronia]
MTEIKEKRVILTVGNIRIKEYDSMNVVIERYEEVLNPVDKSTSKKWRFKGYSHSILSALLFIHRNELLIDKKDVSDLKSYLKCVEDSNTALLKVVKQ